MSVPMIVARVAVSPRVAETHSARASRHAAGSVYDFSSRAPSGLASVRAPRTTRWRATHASSSPSSPGARGETRRQTIHRAFAITSAGAAVGSRVDQRSRSTDQTEAETRNVAERNPSSATERARRRMEQTIANGNETDEQKISATTTTTRPEPELVSLPPAARSRPGGRTARTSRTSRTCAPRRSTWRGWRRRRRCLCRDEKAAIRLNRFWCASSFSPGGASRVGLCTRR